MSSAAAQNRETLEDTVAQLTEWLKDKLGYHAHIDPANLEPTEREANDSGPFTLWFPCPRAYFYGQDSDNPHANRGGPLSYKDRNHRAYAYTAGDTVVFKCQCCTNGQVGATLTPDEYKAELIDEIGLTIGNVVHIGGGEVIGRSHAWPCTATEGTLWHVKYKQSAQKRTWKWRWEYEEPQAGGVRFTIRKPDDLYERSAQSLFGHSVGEEAGVYNRQRMDVYPHAVLVFCEGEKDADMAEELIRIARAEDRMVGICTPYTQIGSSAEVPAAFVNPFVGRSVISCFDRDKAGDNFRLDWAGTLWSHTKSWSEILLEVGEEHGDDPKLNDLSDWVEKNGGVSLDVANLFVRTVEEATPLVERPRGRDHWQIFPSMNKDNRPNKNDEDNGHHLLKYHPELRDVFHRHALTGDIVTVDAPFQSGTKTWSNHEALAMSISAWVKESTPYAMGPRSFTLRVIRDIAKSSDPWSPHEELVSTEWDGTGRAEQLFIDHIPLNCSDRQARALSRMVMTDLSRALRGEPKPLTFKQLVILVPRDIFGLSLVRTISQTFTAAKHNESPKETTVTALMRQGASLIQFPATAVTNYRNRVSSMEVLQASTFDVAGDRIGGPAFLFVGEEGATDLSDVPPSYLVEELKGAEINPISDDLLAQMVAETVARRAEWALLPEPTTESVALAADARERFEVMGALIAYYVYNKVELDGVHGPSSHHVITTNTIQRAEPLEVVNFKACGDAMSAYAKHVYGARYSEALFHRERTAFLRFLLGKPKQKRFLYSHEGKTRAGVRLVSETLSTLYSFYPPAEFTDEDEPENDDPNTNRCSRTPNRTPEEGVDSQENKGVEEIEHQKHSPSAYGGIDRGRSEISHARALRVINKEECSTDLPEEWREAAALLAEAGPCGIDFESYPGDPAYWLEKDKQDAKRAGEVLPKGWTKTRKQEIRKGNAAPRRQPCILTLAKPGGRKAWVRLPGTTSEARDALRRIFAHVHPDIEFIAHHAVFEAEVLAAAGIYHDIHCTMVASKMLYAEAFAWDDDDDDAGFVQYATGDEDVGIVDPVTGQLDIKRLGPIGQPRYHSLAACMEREFGVTRDKTLRSINWASETALEPAYVDYALEDAVNVLDLWEVYEDAMRQIGVWDGYWNLMQALPAVAEINTGGVRVDRAKYDAYMVKLGEEVEAEKAKLFAINGIVPAKKNMNDAMKWWCVGQLWDGVVTASGQDDPEMMFDNIRTMDEVTASYAGRKTIPRPMYWLTVSECIEEAGYDVGSTRGRLNPDTRAYDQPDIGLDKSGLRKLIEFLDATGVAPDLLAYLKIYRTLNKSSTLLANLGDGFASMIENATGRITGHLALAGAVTGRQTCRDVNLQQVPLESDARGCFVASPGRKMIVADYSQVELRVGAVEADDEALFDVYVRGVDVHTATASKCFHIPEAEVPSDLRKKAKAVNFGCLYGAGPPAISESALCSLAEGEVLLDSFLTAYPGIAKYREDKSHETGDIWIVPGRRVMATSEVQGPKRVNYPVQGGAASVQHLALRLVWEALRPLHNQARICLAIHDEIAVECDEAVAERVRDLVKEAMTVALLTLYPTCIDMGRDRLVSIEIGTDWSEKE